MYRIFILVGLLLFFGWYFMYNTGKNTQYPVSYEQILSGALTRNMKALPKNREVIFLRADYIDESLHYKRKKNHSTTLSPLQHDIWKDYSSLEVHTQTPNAFSYAGMTQDVLMGEKEFQNTGNFGTPPIGKVISLPGYQQSSKCSGIIFDPCIVLEEANFGKNTNLHLGDTPIYTNPKTFG